MSLPTLTDIATMFVVIHLLIACLIPIGIAALVTKGMIEANRKTREVMPTIQGYARQMATGAEDVSSRITTPVINTQARAARVRGMWFQATRPLRGSSPPDETTPN